MNENVCSFTLVGYLVALSLQALVDVNLAVPQQPYHPTDELNKRVELVQNILPCQVPGGAGDVFIMLKILFSFMQFSF